ncbi:MAG: hypothetical protein ACJ8H8_11065, partial [Geminicoccaceae bacterium]
MMSLALESAGSAFQVDGNAEGQPEQARSTRDACVDRLRRALETRSSRAYEIAHDGLLAWPADPELLLLAALAALAANEPVRALTLLKRYGKRYKPGKPSTLLTSLALAQQGKPDEAWAMLQAAQLETDRAAAAWFVGDDVMEDWLYKWLREIRRQARLRPGRVAPIAPQPA